MPQTEFRFDAKHETLRKQQMEAACNRSWREVPAKADGAVAELFIDQDLVVPSRRIANMLTARGGGPIKLITRSAIDDLEAMWLGKRVHLFLHIRVARDKTAQLRLDAAARSTQTGLLVDG